MIMNKRQLSIAQKEVEILKEKIKPLNASNEVRAKSQAYAWRCRIEDLEEEINEFKSLADATELEFSTDDLSKAVISLRVASGMTQKELAEEIMVQEQQIQRYEQDDYRKASFERIVQIMQELSKDIHLKIELKKAKRMRLFTDINQHYSNVDVMQGAIRDNNIWQMAI